MSKVCTPENIHGPFERWTFLGLSVSSFNVEGGWDAQAGSLTVNLVRDTCVGETRHYFDGNLVERTTTAADPEFSPPIAGTPLLFRFGSGFEFSGLLQSWEEINGEGGNIFVVKLVDPSSVILDKVQLIIGDYSGSLIIRDVENPLQSYSVPNVINCYGYAEAVLGGTCPQTEINGGTFGSPAGAFAGVVNGNGMRWNIISEAATLLTSSFPPTQNQFRPMDVFCIGERRPLKLQAELYRQTSMMQIRMNGSYLTS